MRINPIALTVNIVNGTMSSFGVEPNNKLFPINIKLIAIPNKGIINGVFIF
jgi:hypothetical protein